MKSAPLPPSLARLVRRAGYENLRAWIRASGASENTVFAYRSRGREQTPETLAKLAAVAGDRSITTDQVRSALLIPPGVGA